jgi:hypothetical protein
MKSVTAGFVVLDDAPGLGVRPPALGEQPGGGEVLLHRHVTAHEKVSHG